MITVSTDCDSSTNLYHLYSIAERSSIEDIKTLFHINITILKDADHALAALLSVLKRKHREWDEKSLENQGFQAFAELYEKLYETALKSEEECLERKTKDFLSKITD